MSLDLHIHSTFSDGTLSPTELIVLAKNKGLKAISITDHDTAAGVSEAFIAGQEYDIEVVTGLEISVQHNDVHFHVLGYFFDVNNQPLNDALTVIQEARSGRNSQIIAKLVGFGIDITEEEVRDISKIGQTGRPHIARALIEKGVVNNMDEAFRKYLRRGEKAYVSRYALDADEAIRLISEAGGIAVLAHPALLDFSLKTLPPLVDELVSFGLAGIETYYPTHSSKIRKKLRKIADHHNLVLTGGSDYHGDIRAGTSLAGDKRVTVPYELLEKMKNKVAAVKLQ